MASDPLHLSHQTIEELLDPAYWAQLCPWLTVASSPPPQPSPAVPVLALAVAAAVLAADPSGSEVLLPLALAAATLAAPALVLPAVTAAAAALAAAALASAALSAAARSESLIQRGFFRLSAAEAALPAGLVGSLERGVLRLVSLGHAPSAISIYSEAWQVAHCLGSQLSQATGNVSSGDTVAFLVTPSSHVFTGPHRDKPLAGAASFRATGAPLYTTAWVALSPATPDASCLYFVPADRDAGYRHPGDALAEALPSPAHWPSIVAQPCAPGEVLCFSHRLLHWGSTSHPSAPPRVALSFAFADPAFELAAFSPEHLPYPPHGLRLGLLAGQAIIYASQAPLDKGALALNNRIFASQQGLFEPGYADKVLGAAQTLKFMAKMGVRH
jgi:hypothetical protein